LEKCAETLAKRNDYWKPWAVKAEAHHELGEWAELIVFMTKAHSLTTLESSKAELFNKLEYWKRRKPKSHRLLGIEREASIEEVKVAFRRLALRHHPDKLQNATQDAIEINRLVFEQLKEAREDMLSKARR